MTRQEAMELTHQMRQSGHTWRSIVEHLNGAGSRIKGDSPWRINSLFNAYTRWVEKGCKPKKPAKTAKPKVPAPPVTEREHLSGTPREILASDPTNAAALADLADRRRYFETQRLDTKAIRRINRMYREGEST